MSWLVKIKNYEGTYKILALVEQLEGLVIGARDNILGSYFHLHFGSEPSLAKRFIETCAAWNRNSGGDRGAI